MNTIFHDVRFALRSLFRNAGFSATVVIVMALGVGATTFAFVAINGMVLKPLPYPDSDELVHIELISSENPNGFEIGMHDVRDLAAEQTAFEDLFAYHEGTVNVSGEDRPVRHEGVFVTANALEQLGVAPVLGRTFVEGEDRPGAPVGVIIGWNLWQQQYDASPDVIGRQMRVNGAPAEIIGVMPDGFLWPRMHQIWIPMQQDTDTVARGETTTVEAFGRLRDGVDIEQARAEFATLYKRIQAANPAWNPGATTDLKYYRDEFIGNETKSVLTAMMLATALVLLIACANVANLILARTIGRSRELSVRAALGANRWRLISGTLTESVALSLVGGALGLVIAHFGGKAVQRFLIEAGDGFPYWMSFEADWRVALFALGIATAAGTLAGILPALRFAARDVTEGLKSSGGGGASVSIGRFTRALVGVEIALSCALLVGGALTVRSVINLQNAPIGADVSGVMSGRVGLFEAQYPDANSRRQLWEEFEARVAELPGVTDATVTTSLPTYGSGSTRFLEDGVEPPPDGQLPFARHVIITPSFFDTVRAPLVSGRAFNSADRADSMPVAIVNRAFAERNWPGEVPIGKRLSLGSADAPPVTVVGVAANIYHHGLQDGPVQPVLYQPLAQSDVRFASIAARTDGDPDLLANPIRDALRAVDSDLPVYWLQPAQVWVDQSRATSKLLGMIFGAFGIAAVLLASVGVYGVLAFAVTRRAREFGVRRALGADPRGIVGLVLRQGMRQLLVALPVGLLLAYGLGRILASVLANVSSVDPVSFIGIPVLLALTVIIASFVPARRAANVDPMAALRDE